MNINELDAYFDKQIELYKIELKPCDKAVLRLIIRDIHNDGFKEGNDFIMAKVEGE